MEKQPGPASAKKPPHASNEDLDHALEDTFPASDPPAMNQPTQTSAQSQADDLQSAYVVLCEGVCDKPLEEWKTCGHARWVSARTPVIMLALSPALAVLDALALHGMRQDCRWTLVRLQFPAAGMRRLDTPHDGWRERTYRDEVRADGDRWAEEKGSALLRVPSPLCPGEYNVLVNLSHPERDCIQVHDDQILDVDARLRPA